MAKIKNEEIYRRRKPIRIAVGLKSGIMVRDQQERRCVQQNRQVLKDKEPLEEGKEAVLSNFVSEPIQCLPPPLHLTPRGRPQRRGRVSDRNGQNG